MNIRHLGLVLLLLFTINGYSQNWASLNGGANNTVLSIYGDTINNILYATGDFSTIGGVNANRIAKWNGITWDSINNGLLNVALMQHSFTQYNGDLIHANYLFNVNRHHVAKWNGTQWDSIGVNFFPKSSGGFLGIFTLNNDLYVCGVFDSINNISYNGIAKWNGLNWMPVGFPYTIQGQTPYVKTLAIYNNELYAGGLFSDSTGAIANIAKFNGSYWSIVGGGFHGPIDQVFNLVVYKNELYAAGEFKTDDGNPGNYIARWNGTIWRDVGGGVTSPFNGQINDLLLLNNKLYACGSFDEIGGVPAKRIAAWDGINWCGFGNTSNTSIGSLAAINNDLYLTCGDVFDGVIVNRIAKWIGGNYVDTCGNTTGIDESATDKKELNIYPNPATNQITIEFETTKKDVLIEIKNVLGQAIYSEALKNVVGKQSKSLDLSILSNGVYFVQVQNGKGMMSKKFIKQ